MPARSLGTGAVVGQTLHRFDIGFGGRKHQADALGGDRLEIFVCLITSLSQCFGGQAPGGIIVVGASAVSNTFPSATAKWSALKQAVALAVVSVQSIKASTHRIGGR